MGAWLARPRAQAAPRCGRTGSQRRCSRLIIYHAGSHIYLSRRGPAVGMWRSEVSRKSASEILRMLRLRTSDELSVRIRLRRDLGLSEAEVSTKLVSKRLFVLELQSSWSVARLGRTAATRVQLEQMLQQTRLRPLEWR
eukprot:923914-Prymnesium_polylepis.2